MDLSLKILFNYTSSTQLPVPEVVVSVALVVSSADVPGLKRSFECSLSLNQMEEYQQVAFFTMSSDSVSSSPALVVVMLGVVGLGSAAVVMP